MTLRSSLIIQLLIAFTSARALAQDFSPAASVDCFIGTNPNPFTHDGYSFDTGNVYPGAVCPRGMVAWSPDTENNSKIAGGYWYPDKTIEDFSLTHFSGRGVPCLKDIAFMPIPGPVEISPGKKWSAYAAPFKHENESASAGYYRVKFDNGIETQLTCTLRTGSGKFNFGPLKTSSLLIRTNGAVTVNGNEVSGQADWQQKKQMVPKVYFFARFAHPIKSVQTWDGDAVTDKPTASGKSCGAILTFDTSTDSTVPVRLGISYTSLKNAKENLDRENASEDFDSVHQAAVAMWNKELGRIEVTGGTADQSKVFYTALYHCCIHPNYLDDVNGEYRGMDGKIHRVDAGHHQYQNIPAWDEHRSHVQLMAILTPDQSSDVMQSLVNYARQDESVRPHGGGLPRWEQVNINSGGMVGDGDDTIIASAYAFGARDFDTKAALAAMEKGASDPTTTSDDHRVRENLAEYLKDGYVPGNASITLEYASDDFALSQFALSLGDTQKAEHYLKQAQGWEKLFDKSTGYIRTKDADGKWVEPFKPSSARGYVEGSPAQYLWLVNFNVKGLIDQIGGNEKTVERLDKFFTKTNDGQKSEYAYMGNEPCEECPWIYDFAGAPWRTQDVVRRIQTELFTTQPSGLPGNDDAGSLSSWYVFSALGLYPEIPGVGGFTVGSPVFPKAIVHLPHDKTIQIIGQHAAPDSPYVQSLQVNGKAHDSPWIPWAALSNGASLNFDLGDKPSKWGSDPAKAPPSFDR
jgi:predicted alpha-1,2-mannosidase